MGHFASVNELDNKSLGRKIVFVILVILVLGLIGYMIYTFTGNNKDNALAYNYSLNVDYSNVIYMKEPTSLSIKVDGTDKDVDQLYTSLLIYDDIISLSDYDIPGKSGDVTVIPVSVGEETIHLYTIVGYEDEEGGVDVDTKDITVTVCPAFDYSRLLERNITLKKNSTYRIRTNFDNQKCISKLTYASHDNSIATVSNEGVVKGIKPGKTTLIVSNGNKVLNIPVKVMK